VDDGWANKTIVKPKAPEVAPSFVRYLDYYAADGNVTAISTSGNVIIY
jgi:hypothetical protein